jgi:gamma-glutamylcyclotransferase (GGCT)/AIG2-like uncharacterized protein YtfP
MEMIFAYGCNVDPFQLRRHCPNARVVGTAVLRGHKLVFGGWTEEWGGPTASLQSEEGAICPGVVFRVEDKELEALDILGEGCDGAYKRVEFEVELKSGESHVVQVYVLKSSLANRTPSGKYVSAVLIGYKLYKLDSRHFLKILPGLLPSSSSKRKVELRF